MIASIRRFLESRRTPGSPTRWASLRGVTLLVIVLVNICAAVPLPGPVTKSTLKDPTAQEEIARWVDLSRSVGYPLTTDEIETIALTSSDLTHSARRWAFTPLKPWFRYTQANQGWGLFAYPDTNPYRLEVFARGTPRDDWETVFASLDFEHHQYGGLLHFRRVRALYNPSRKVNRHYNRFVDHLSERLFAEHPEWNEVRVRLVRTRTTLPGKPPNDSEQIRHVRLRKRETP